jgi:membrane protein
LTLYTLLSIVPVMAMAFGIAKGFGFQRYLETRIIYLFAGQEQVIQNVQAALAGGIIAGTIFQLVQTACVQFQVGVSTYNAIYGSFAALPLFLLWLKASWTIVLFGAEISYVWENFDLLQTDDPEYEHISVRVKKLVRSRILFKVSDPDPGFTPARDIESTTVMDVVTAFENMGKDDLYLGDTLELSALEQSLESFAAAARQSSGERLLKDV